MREINWVLEVLWRIDLQNLQNHPIFYCCLAVSLGPIHFSWVDLCSGNELGSGLGEGAGQGLSFSLFFFHSSEHCRRGVFLEDALGQQPPESVRGCFFLLKTFL